jgi:hypothetical protein
VKTKLAITAATTAVRMNPEQSNDFRKASEALSELIGSLFVMSPTGRLAARISTTAQVPQYGQDSRDISGSRGGCGHGRGGGRGGGRGFNRSQWPRSSQNNETYERDGRRYHNGSDITGGHPFHGFHYFANFKAIDCGCILVLMVLRHKSNKEWCSLHETMPLTITRTAKGKCLKRPVRKIVTVMTAMQMELNLEQKDISD